MKDKIKPYKLTLIYTLTALITVLHYATIKEHPGYHFLHRELFFIPILLTSFWFGLRHGLTASVIISLLYAPHILYYSGPHNRMLTVVIQLLVFNLVAVVLGWLVDRQKKEHEEAVAVENLAVLGRAAGAVGEEMKYLLGSLKNLAKAVKQGHGPELERTIEKETERMEHIVEVLTSFISQDRNNLLSCDINEIIQRQADRHRHMVLKAGIALTVDMDDTGCPTMVNPDKIEWILNNLILNAAEVSPPGKSIFIKSSREDEHCRIEVKDEGPGIHPEHLPKIFTPFFTTKEKGQGLALAGSRKILRDMGGDIRVSSRLGEGAAFIITIPREYSGKTLVNDPVKSVMRGEPVSHLYKE
ncbi:MAG TPA: HAMP domain-containing histidine kinase [Deltaproteobacteria bacterium]|nr:HAMP domain-containing histidine kinase [Deltaproteobacteria bacterium]